MNARDANPDEVPRLRSAIRDLVAFTTLPAIWTGDSVARIGESLAGVLQAALSLDFVCVRLRRDDDGDWLQFARGPQGVAAYRVNALAAALPFSGAPAPSSSPAYTADPFGTGPLRLARVRCGHSGEVIAGSVASGFPTDMQNLLLGVAANQAAIAVERKQVEESLARRSGELEDFFENGTLGLHWVGGDGRIVRVNRAELQMLGYSRDEYVGHHIAEFHADAEVIDGILRRLKAGEDVRECEARLKCKDGSIRYVVIDSNAWWEDGKFQHTRCFTRDITDRKNAEAARDAVSSQLAIELADSRRLHEISAELVVEGDVDALHHRILDAAQGIMNSDMASMQSVDEREDALRMIAFRGFDEEFGCKYALNRPGTRTSCSVARATGRRVVVCDVEHCDFIAGTPALADHLRCGIRGVQSTPLISRDGRILGIISTHWRRPHQPTERELQLLDVLARQAADLIERKQADDAMRKQAERLRLLWKAASVMLTAEDPDVMLHGLLTNIGPHLGVDTYFNYLVNENGDALRLASYAGIPAESAHVISRLEFGQAICGAVAESRQPIVATCIQQSNDPKAQLAKSFGMRAYACNPLVSADTLFGTLSFASRSRDTFDADELTFLETICQYVAVAYERLRLLNQLRETDRRKDEFLATLAHELRNPLAPIRNAVQVLDIKGSRAPEACWGREVLTRQIENLSRLIDDLLDISRITRNRLELRKDRIELAGVIQGAVESSRPTIEQCGHELTVTLPEQPIHLHADLVRLAQVFLNLLNNAAKYTERGGRIVLTAELDCNHVVVRVKDNGIGLPADKLRHIFEMFYQVDASFERSQGGLGIGLSLVRRLVELHGGTIEARSAGAGKGSEFIVRLPMLGEVPEPVFDGVRGGDVGRAPPPPRRMLVIDDNRDAADSLAMLLRLTGNEVHTAYDGKSGLEDAERLRPEVALVDIGMPKLNGHDVCRRIRAQPWGERIMVIALTGWGQEEDRRRTEEAGFDAHLVKPVDFDLMTKLLSVPEATRARISGRGGGIVRRARSHAQEELDR